MPEKVQNCKEKKVFKVDIKNPFFPISGSGVVSQEYCGKETSEFPEGYAHLCTDNSRRCLYCHNTRCGNIIPQ